LIDCSLVLHQEQRMAISYDFTGHVAVVTGGARGIGRAVSERHRESGADVWVWDKDPVEVPETRSLSVDVTRPADVADGLSKVVAQHARLDIPVNSAGLLGGAQPFERHHSDDWNRIIAVNLIGVIEVCSAVLPHMRKSGRGRIVNMGSLAGKEGLANMAVYSAASAGVIAFTKALGRELAQTGIRVNCVAPGPIETRMILDLGDEVVQRLVEISPMKRLGLADEVADLVLWLCSDACSFSTGAVFDISGGRATY
jgi:NAD(P)-dependent dehydrogenase (short-subunit alcohol dehydrogenase family)